MQSCLHLPTVRTSKCVTLLCPEMQVLFMDGPIGTVTLPLGHLPLLLAATATSKRKLLENVSCEGNTTATGSLVRIGVLERFGQNWLRVCRDIAGIGFLMRLGFLKPLP